MTVTRLHHTPLGIAVTAARTCWDSGGKGGCYPTPTDKITTKDRELLARLVKKFKHESVVEHCTVSFAIDGISRGCLQELARHRMQNLSVRSSRYTLGKALREAPPIIGIEDAGRFCVLTGDPGVDVTISDQITALQHLAQQHPSLANDMLKYGIPECLKTSLVSTMNIRSLRNFLHLRIAKDAHWEIRQLAKAMLRELPDEWRFLFDDI